MLFNWADCQLVERELHRREHHNWNFTFPSLHELPTFAQTPPLRLPDYLRSLIKSNPSTIKCLRFKLKFKLALFVQSRKWNSGTSRYFYPLLHTLQAFVKDCIKCKMSQSSIIYLDITKKTYFSMKRQKMFCYWWSDSSDRLKGLRGTLFSEVNWELGCEIGWWWIPVTDQFLPLPTLACMCIQSKNLLHCCANVRWCMWQKANVVIAFDAH